MNFTELKAELAARGFDYLTDARLGRYINLARAELDDDDLWNYREKTATGEAPLTVTDLGTVDAVIVDGRERLQGADWGWLQATFSGLLDLQTAPRYWYRATPAGVPTVATYPTAAGSDISVQYWRVTPDLTGTEVPAAPTRFHNLIVDIAARLAYRDADNHEAAEQIQVEIDRALMRMRLALGLDQTGPVDGVQITEWW